MLDKAMKIAPDQNAIRTMAQDKPIEWARFVQIFASLAGYSTKTEVKKDISIILQTMTNQQLDDAISKIERGEIIDLEEYVEIKP